MKKEKSILFLPLLIIFFAVLSGCSASCAHQWTEADCTTPKTCTKCGETEGDAAGHSWAEATCEVLSTCTRCKETTGTVLEHTWTEETEYCYDLTKTEYTVCGMCGTKEVKSTGTMQTLINEDGNLFVLPAEEYMKRLAEVYNYGNVYDTGSGDTASEATYSCVWSDETSFMEGPGIDILEKQDGETVCVASVSFLKSAENSQSIAPDEKNIPLSYDTIVLTTRRENAANIDLLSAIIPACDPEVYVGGLGRMILFSSAQTNPVEENGIVYGTIMEEAYVAFTAMPSRNN